MLTFKNQQLVDKPSILSIYSTNMESMENMESFVTYFKKNKTNARSAKTLKAYGLFWLKQGANPQRLGQLAEIYVMGWLGSQGYQTRYTAQVGNVAGDVAATDTTTGEIHRIEVKAARPSTDGRWHFCIANGRTDATDSDYVVLLVIDQHHKIYPYIAPSQTFTGITKFKISSHPTRYRGRLAPYRVRSDSINFQIAQDIYDLRSLS